MDIKDSVNLREKALANLPTLHQCYLPYSSYTFSYCGDDIFICNVVQEYLEANFGNFMKTKPYNVWPDLRKAVYAMHHIFPMLDCSHPSLALEIQLFIKQRYN